MNACKRKGSGWEAQIVAFLQASGWPHAERRVLHGARDLGDVTGILGVVIEGKNTARIELSEWIKEAQAETANAGAEVGVVWAKRRARSSASDGFVIMDGATLVHLLKLAGW